MKKCLITLFLLLLTIGGYAMIETLSLEQLVQGADIVVTGTIKGIKSAGKLPEGPEVLACLFEVGEILKGEVKVGDSLKIKNYRGIEDMPDFKEGSRYVLFLKKVESHFEVFNSIQGSWPIDTDGKFLGMGHGQTLAQIKTALKAKPAKQTEFKPVTF